MARFDLIKEYTPPAGAVLTFYSAGSAHDVADKLVLFSDRDYLVSRDNPIILSTEKQLAVYFAETTVDLHIEHAIYGAGGVWLLDQHFPDTDAAIAAQVAAEASAVATAADRVQTAADRVQTGLDVTAANAGAAAATGMGYPTRALMDAAAGLYTEGQVVRVTNDPTPANNGDWIKGVSVFTQASFDRVAVVEQNIITKTHLVYDHSDASLADSYIIKDTGVVITGAAGWKATNFLEVMPNTSYEVSSIMSGTNAVHAWYDANKVYISHYGIDVSTPLTVTSPLDAKYARFSVYVGTGGILNVKSTINDYDIARLREVLTLHSPNIESDKVIVDTGTLTSVLDTIKAQQTSMLVAQAVNTSQIDLLTDRDAPFFIDTWAFTKSGDTSAVGTDEATVVSRDGDYVFTVQPGRGTHFVANGTLVVKDASGRITSHAIETVLGDVITVFDILPATLVSCQAMFDSNLGQHLSRMGYLGLADYVSEQVQKYSYKKAVLFQYHPPICRTPGYTDPDIYDITSTTKLIDVTPLAGAGGGGWVAGTSNLARSCSTTTASKGVTLETAAGYYSHFYLIRDAVAGRGVEFSFPVNLATGFIEMMVSGPKESYISSVDGLSYKASGDFRVEVVGDGDTVLHDKTYNAGSVKFICFDFSDTTSIKVRLTQTASVPTSINLLGLYAYSKSPITPTDLIVRPGNIVAFLGDSWTQYPLAVGDEVLPLRPDGSTGDGMQFLSKRIKDNFAAVDLGITTLNMGRGGQTSAWGKHWVNSIINLTPRPTHCVVCFYINDRNSLSYYTADADSAYDFDPANQWINKVKSIGGVKGSVSHDLWFANMKYISDQLLSAGIKPIIMMPSHTASATQAQNLRDNFLSKMGCGFRNDNETGGGE